MHEETGSSQSGLVISRPVSKRVVTSAAPWNLRVPARNLAGAGEVTCPTHPTMTKSARAHHDSHQVTMMQRLSAEYSPWGARRGTISCNGAVLHRRNLFDERCLGLSKIDILSA
jgi:hypothetical protein